MADGVSGTTPAPETGAATGADVDPQLISDRASQSMMVEDRAARALGIKLVEISPGRAVMRMVVRRTMLNGHDMGHGGMTFTLADTTFGCACNSFNQNAVAQSAQIAFLRPTREGDVLTATATATAFSGRTGIFDVLVTNQRGEKIATFRGQSQTIKGQHVPDLPVLPLTETTGQ